MREVSGETPRFRRAIGVVILSVALSAAAVVWFALAANNPSRVPLAAVGLALLFAAGVAWLEFRILMSTRRSSGDRSTPLVPKTLMAATRGVYAGPVTVTVLIPAHNEESRLGRTLESLAGQYTLPCRVVVIADNCTDSTVAIARAAGVEVVATVGNRDKKAGALNQVLREVLPDQGDNDLMMILDADTALDPGFLTTAAARFENDRALMAVGGLYYGEDGSGVIGQLQRNEFARYSRAIDHRDGRPFVLTGTASIFRAVALRTVAESRGTLLPGRAGDVYDTAALAEDDELTLALNSLGALMLSPHGCRVVTEVVTTWRALWTQRVRRIRGTLENLAAYGPTRQTLRSWAQQLGSGYGVIACGAFVTLVGIMAFTARPSVSYPFWLGIGALFVAERVVTAWSGGWRARVLAALLVPELLYALVLNAAYLVGVLSLAMGRRADWDAGDHQALAEASC